MAELQYLLLTLSRLLCIRISHKAAVIVLTRLAICLHFSDTYWC